MTPDSNTDQHSCDSPTEQSKDSEVTGAVPDNPDSNHNSPYNIITTYHDFKSFIVDSSSYGRSIWDILRIIAGVLVIGSILFFLTGLLTPFVAVNSGSMEPNIKTGDLVLLTAHDPDSPPPLAGSGEITTLRESKESESESTSFGKAGDVIVFEQESEDMPIIHRAHFKVEKGENWIEDADPRYLNSETTCGEVQMCPAPNDGYITAGDSNDQYDQVEGNHRPVTESDIVGVAQYRIPHAGWIRLGFNEIIP